MRSLLFGATVLYSLSAFAQTGVEDFSRLQQQMQVEQLNHQLRMQQFEMETERIRATTRRLDGENQRREESDKASSMLAEQERKREEAEKEATDEAEELRMQVHMAGVRSTDNMYVLAAAGALIAFFVVVVRRRNKEDAMKHEQKFGVVLVVASALGMALALMISRDWAPQLDVLQNVMLRLRIAFIEDDASSLYIVDVPTKFILFAFACVAAYGLLAYLGIAPAFGGKKEPAPNPEVA